MTPARLHLIVSMLCMQAASAQADALFDAHLHYNAAYADSLTPAQVIATLKAGNIRHAAIMSRPPGLVQRLHALDPERIVTLLGAYRTLDDKSKWMHDTSPPARMREQLQTGAWNGIGELHIFAADRHSEVLRDIVELANEYQLPIMLHADPAVIDSVYEYAPATKVLWAHAGTYPYPDLVSDYLQRYSNLCIDLSVRGQRIVVDGDIADDWYQLMVTYPDRVLLGVDTFSATRWRHYADLAAQLRDMLALLPNEIADKIRHSNAARLFATQKID